MYSSGGLNMCARMMEICFGVMLPTMCFAQTQTQNTTTATTTYSAPTATNTTTSTAITITTTTTTVNQSYAASNSLR